MNATLNVGRVDRGIRLVIGLALITVSAWGLPSGTATGAVWAAGAILFATATTGFCPLYALAGISTRGGLERRRRVGSRK